MDAILTLERGDFMIAMGSDHGGYLLKEHIKAFLQSKGYQVLDCGCDKLESVDD